MPLTIGPNVSASKFSSRVSADDSRGATLSKFEQQPLARLGADQLHGKQLHGLAVNCSSLVDQARALHRDQRRLAQREQLDQAVLAVAAGLVEVLDSRRRRDHVAPLPRRAERRAADGSNSISRPGRAAIERHGPSWISGCSSPAIIRPLGVIARLSNPWLSRRPVLPSAVI